MIVELAVATAMVALTVAMHAAGLAILAGRMPAIEKAGGIAWLSARGVGFAIALALGLFVLHGLEIWAYAALYLTIGAAPDLAAAVYVSTISYAAIGFSDAELAAPWRLVAGIEGINGIVLIGWSTAFLVTVMGGLRMRR